MKLTVALLVCWSILLFLPSFAQQRGRDAERVNQAAGLPLLPPAGEWSGKVFEKRLKQYGLFFQGDKTRRSVYLENRKIFNVPATELVMICDPDGLVTQLDIVFFNKGDSARSRSLRKDIRRSGASLKQLLKSLMGNPRDEKFGPAGLQMVVPAWTCGKVRFLLETRYKEYTIIHVCYREESPKKPRKRELRIRGDQFFDNVRTSEFGDVYLENIPMVDQGEKGYCVPATFERVLRYFGIKNVNLHQLADAADTDRGGTSFDSMIGSTARLRRSYGLRVHSCGEIKIETLKNYIGQGFPVMWGLYINPAFLKLLDESRKHRPRNSSPRPWLQSLRKYKLPQRGEGHMCLIVGFNEETDEIAVSNSWGDKEGIPAWIPLKLASRVSMRTTFVLVPGK